MLHDFPLVEVRGEEPERDVRHTPGSAPPSLHAYPAVSGPIILRGDDRARPGWGCHLLPLLTQGRVEGGLGSTSADAVGAAALFQHRAGVLGWG